MLLAPEELRNLLQDALQTKYIILPCSDIGAAKELLLSAPDILILSLSLPGGTSLAFLKENCTLLPPRIIALSVFFNNAILSELANLGISHVIQLPCKLSYLEEKLKNTPPDNGRGQTLDVRRILWCGDSETPHR